MTCNGINYSKR